MTSSEFKRIARILKAAYQEVENEALKNGADITSPQYQELLNIVRERILKRQGYTLKEYREAKEGVVNERQEKTDQRTQDLLEGAIRPVAESSSTKEEVAALEAKLKELESRPPQNITRIEKETIVEKPITKIIKEVKIERVDYNDKPLWAEMGYLNDKLESIKIPEIPEVPIIDVPKLKGELLNEMDVRAKKQIDIMGMPDFRKLAMGIQARVEEVAASVVANADADVSGPSSATDSNVVLFDGVTGKIVKDSGQPFTKAGIGLSNVDNTSDASKPVSTATQTALDLKANTSTTFSGVYSPAITVETNLDATTTATEAQYMRVGNTVTVSGRFTANATLTATATSFEMSLPVASNIGAVEDAAGVAFCGTVAGMGAVIIGSVANNTAVVSWVASDPNVQTWSYQFSYAVI